MRPHDHPFDLDQLHAVWQAFVVNGAGDSADSTVIDPVVVESWRRCRPRLDPHAQPRPSRLHPDRLDALLQRQQELIAVALPHLEDIHQFTIGSDSVILLTDRTGCAVALQGDPEGIAILAGYGLGLGTYWSEGRMGTNALALALVTAMPTQVVGAEHFHQAYHRFATTAAPLHAANGQIIGLLALVTPATDATSRDLALVMSATRAISNQLQTDRFVEEVNAQLTQVNAILETVLDGVLMWDSFGRINHCNTRAAQMFGTEASALRGEPIDRVVRWPDDVQAALAQHQPLTGYETSLQVAERRVNCLLTARPIHNAHTATTGYVALLRPAAQVRRLVNQQVGTEAAFTIDELSSAVPAMQRVLQQARTAARGSMPILLEGENGVGKTYVAQAIHNAGPRAGRPFLSVNCRAIPHQLILSELLGVEGSAERAGRPSKFELADGGTLMLNQVQYLTLEMQALLLEVIDRRHITRINGTRPIPVNVRIIATTPPNAEALVTNKSLIPELYIRFSIFRLAVPPLRQRVDDIVPLVERFLARMSERQERPANLDDEASAVLKRYPWPGNVRELESVLERALAQSRDGVVRVIDLPSNVRRGRVLREETVLPEPVQNVMEAEREAIIRAGYACQGAVTQMARELGIGRTTLWRKMKRYGLTPELFKTT